MSFYVVKGTNGVILQQYYNRALHCRHYLRHGTIKKYETFGEAEIAAKDHLSEIVPYYIPIPDVIKLDEMLTIAKLARQQKEEGEKN